MIRTQSTISQRRQRARPALDSFSNNCVASELAELSATIHGLRRSLSELECNILFEQRMIFLVGGTYRSECVDVQFFFLC